MDVYSDDIFTKKINHLIYLNSANYVFSISRYCKNCVVKSLCEKSKITDQSLLNEYLKQLKQPNHVEHELYVSVLSFEHTILFEGKCIILLQVEKSIFF